MTRATVTFSVSSVDRVILILLTLAVVLAMRGDHLFASACVSLAALINLADGWRRPKAIAPEMM